MQRNDMTWQSVYDRRSLEEFRRDLNSSCLYGGTRWAGDTTRWHGKQLIFHWFIVFDFYTMFVYTATQNIFNSYNLDPAYEKSHNSLGVSYIDWKLSCFFKVVHHSDVWINIDSLQIHSIMQNEGRLYE